MARKLSTQGDFREDWRRLIPPLVANTADMPHLEAPRTQLERIDTEVEDLLARQAALTAEKQEITQRLLALFANARRLAAFLRVGIRQRYGPRSEKLAEFNLLPFRGRKKAKLEPEPGPEVVTQGE